MNQLGLAIAVDSAVSIGANARSYPNADKLFTLGNGAPVAIAIYGTASFQGVPWKLVIESFAARLGEQRLATLEEYQQAFIAFCESEHPLFSAEQEAADFKQTVSAYWRFRLRPIFTAHGEDVRAWKPESWDDLRRMLETESSRWEVGLRSGFQESFASEVLETFAPQVDELRQYWFDGEALPDDVWARFLETIKRLYTRDVIGTHQSSGLVFLGYGETEYYPRFSQITIGSRVLGRLRWQQGEASAITVNGRTGVVEAFAQPDMIDAFILGIPRRMRESLKERIEEASRAVLRKAKVSEEEISVLDIGAEVHAATDEFFGLMHEGFRAPIMETVAALPTPELAALSRTLVSLAAFRSQLLGLDSGSVGGAIRVATVTKHGGVQWSV